MFDVNISGAFDSPLTFSLVCIINSRRSQCVMVLRLKILIKESIEGGCGSEVQRSAHHPEVGLILTYKWTI